MDLTYLISSIITLTLVMDPMGNIPIFISTLKNVPEKRKRKVVVRELFIALSVMIFFLFFGKSVMTLLNINMVSLSVAGGIILFIIAIGMIFPGNKTTFAENPGGEPFIVPLAIPLVCGPSTLTVILIFTMREPKLWNVMLVVILCAWLINILILGCSNYLSKLLGKRGMLAVEKLMGMFLVTLSVQMFLDGIKNFLMN